MVRKGEPWGRPVGGTPDVSVSGDDGALAEVVARQPRARVTFAPTSSSDFARAVGLAPGTARTTPMVELPCDALTVVGAGQSLAVVNMLVVGTEPRRLHWWTPSFATRVTVDDHVVHAGSAATIVVANGQYLQGRDLVPRGHPGDGRAEVQVYMLPRRERRVLRDRLRTSTHLPHPQIVTATGRAVTIEALGRPVPVTTDGRPRGRFRQLEITVTPEAFLLLV